MEVLNVVPESFSQEGAVCLYNEYVAEILTMSVLCLRVFTSVNVCVSMSVLSVPTSCSMSMS